VQQSTKRAHSADQHTDVCGAANSGVAVREPLHCGCRSAESGDRMTSARIGQHEVDQVAGKHTDNPGVPRRPKHPGSVSYVVYSVT
jgi:hypothetical protein